MNEQVSEFFEAIKADDIFGLTTMINQDESLLNAVNENGVGWISESTLTADETADEVLLMGLRIAEGLDAARVETLRGRALNPEAVKWLIEQELITRDETRLRLTSRGRALANRIALELAV